MDKTLRLKFKKILYVCVGFSFLVLSYFGIIMPGVPAIPFILLALFFFANSSERLYKWMISQKIVAKIISKINTNKGNLAFKLFVISQLWVSIIVAECIFVTNFYYGIFLIISGIGFSFITYRLMNK